MKKKTTLGLIGLAAAGAGAAGGLAALGNALYHRVNHHPARDPDAPEVNQVQKDGRAWARAGETFQSVRLQASDGLSLWAALLPASAHSHAWAICMHGYCDTHEAMGAIALHYHQAGWNVLLPDQRGHGNSEGDYVGWGYDERLDLVSWVNFIVRRDPDAEIVLHGVSMGGATVLMATGGVLPRQVKAAVSDCSYTSIEAEMRYMVSRHRKDYTPVPVPSGVLFSILRKATLRRACYDLRDAAPIQAVTQSKTPTLFIHGVDDELVPPPMMGKLYQAARCPKSFLWMPGAGHTAAAGANPALYWTAVSTFLQEYVSFPV